MPTAPALSVVMPVHNGERFLRLAVESILAQTFTDFEFVVVDDGSTDGTGDVLREFAARDRRLLICRLDRNSGVTAALNAGVSRSAAPLIARMDADDISVPVRFERQIAFLGEHPDIAAVGSWVDVIDEEGTLLETRRYPPDPSLLAWCMLFFNAVVHPTVMMRRAALPGDAPYSSQYYAAEDYALFLRMSWASGIATYPEPLLRFRRWRGSISNDSRQFGESVRLLHAFVAGLGLATDEASVRGLLGLARDRYPDAAAELRSIGDLIQTLHKRYHTSRALTREQRAAVARDAAVRLWLLASLALPRRPDLAASLGHAAARLDPFSFGHFAGKVVQRCFGARPARCRSRQ